MGMDMGGGCGCVCVLCASTVRGRCEKKSKSKRQKKKKNTHTHSQPHLVWPVQQGENEHHYIRFYTAHCILLDIQKVEFSKAAPQITA